MGGNVWEWNDSIPSPGLRGLRGGSWNFLSHSLQSSIRVSRLPTIENTVLGFRVASIPEPATGSMMLIALMTLGCRRKRG